MLADTDSIKLMGRELEPGGRLTQMKLAWKSVSLFIHTGGMPVETSLKKGDS